MAARVFLDTSVLIAAVFSRSGGARMLLTLGEAGAILPLASRHVLAEADRVLRRKAPDALPDFAVLMERAGLQVAPTGDADGRARRPRLLPRSASEGGQAAAPRPGRRPGPTTDTEGIADAAAAKADYFVTLDKEHFLGNRKLRNALVFPLGTPGDFIAWFKRLLAPG